MSRTNYRDWPTRILDKELLTKVVPSSKKLDMSASSCSTSEDRNKNVTALKQTGKRGKYKSKLPHTGVEDSEGITASTAISHSTATSSSETSSDNMATTPSSLPQKQKIQTKKTYACTFCEVKFGSKYKYNLHKKREEHKILGGEVFSDILDKNKVDGKCPICGYYFSSRHCIVRHLRRTMLLSGDKKCAFCLHTFKTEVNLTRHIDFCHADSSKAQKIKYEDDECFVELVEKKGDLFQCKICLRSYKNKNLCIRHAEQCERFLKHVPLSPTPNLVGKGSKKTNQESACEMMVKNNLQYEDILYKDNDRFHCRFCRYSNTKRCRTVNHVFHAHEYCSICKIPFCDKSTYTDHINALHGGVIENKDDVKDTKMECVSSECDGKTTGSSEHGKISSDEDDDVLYSLNTAKTDQSKNLIVNVETKNLKVNFEAKSPKLETKNPRVETKSPKMNEAKSPKVKKAKSPKPAKVNQETSKIKSPKVSLEKVQDFGTPKPDGFWECKLCDGSRCLNNRNAFLRHLRLSHLLCTICFRGFKTNLVFKKHLFKKHNMNDNHLKSYNRGTSKKITVMKPCRNLKGTAKAIRLSNHRLKSKKGSYITSGPVIKMGIEEEFSQNIPVATSSQTSDSPEVSGSDVSAIVDDATVPSDLAILNLIDTEKSLSVELVPVDISSSVKLNKSSVIKNGPTSSRPLPNKYKDLVQKPSLKIAKLGNGSSDKKVVSVDTSKQEKSVYFKDVDLSENSDLDTDIEIGTLPETRNKTSVIIERPAPSWKYLSTKSKYTSGTKQPLSLQDKDSLTTTPFVVLNKLNNINDMKAIKTNFGSLRHQRSGSKNAKRFTSKPEEKINIVSSQTNQIEEVLQVDDPINVASTLDLSSASSEVNNRITSAGAQETVELHANNSSKKIPKNIKSHLRNLRAGDRRQNRPIDPVLGTENQNGNKNRRDKSCVESMEVEDNMDVCQEVDLNKKAKNDMSLNSDQMVLTSDEEGRAHSLQKVKRGRGRPPKMKKTVDQVSDEAMVESNTNDELSLSTLTNNESSKPEELTDTNEEQNISSQIDKGTDTDDTHESDTRTRCEMDSNMADKSKTSEKTKMEDQIGEHLPQKTRSSRVHPSKTGSKIQNAVCNMVDKSSPTDFSSDEKCDKSEDTDDQGLVEKDAVSCDSDTTGLLEEDGISKQVSGSMEVKDVKENVKVKDIKEVKLVAAQNLQKYGYEMLVSKLPVVTLTRIHKNSSLDSIENQSKKNNKVLKSVYSLRKKSKERKSIVDENGDGDVVSNMEEHGIVKVDSAKNRGRKRSLDNTSLSVESEDEGMCTEDEIDGSLVSELGMHEVNEEFLDSSLSSINDELFNEMPFLDESILNAEFEMIEDLSNNVSVYDQIEIEEKNGSWESFHKSCPSQKTLALGLLSCLQLTSCARTNGHTDLVDEAHNFECENVKKSGSLTDCSDLDMMEKDNNDNYELSDDLNKNLKELQASVLMVRKTKKHAKLKSLKKLSDKKLTSKKCSNFLTKTSGEIDNDCISDSSEKVQSANSVQDEVVEKRVVDVAMETKLTENAKNDLPDERNDVTVVLEPVYTLNTVVDNSLVKVGTVLSNSVVESIQIMDNAGDRKRSSTFACNWCKKSYKNKHSLQMHKSKKHSSQISPEKDDQVNQKQHVTENDSVIGLSKNTQIITKSDMEKSKVIVSPVAGDKLQNQINVDEKTINFPQNDITVTTIVSSAGDVTKDSMQMSSLKVGKTVSTVATNVNESNVVLENESSDKPISSNSGIDGKIKLTTSSKTNSVEVYTKESENIGTVAEKTSAGIYHVCQICGLRYRASENLSIHLRTCHNIHVSEGNVNQILNSVDLNSVSRLVNKTDTSSKVTANIEIQLESSENTIHSGVSPLETESDEICNKEENRVSNIQIEDQADLDLKNMVVDIERANFQVSMETAIDQTESFIDKITGESEDIIPVSCDVTKHTGHKETTESNEIVGVTTANVDAESASKVQAKNEFTPHKEQKSLKTHGEKNTNTDLSNKSPFKNTTFPVKIKFEKSAKGKKKSLGVEKSDKNTPTVKKKRGRPPKKLLSSEDTTTEEMVTSKASSDLENRNDSSAEYQQNESANLKTNQEQLEINFNAYHDIPQVSVKSFEEVLDENYEKVLELNKSVTVSKNLECTSMSPTKNLGNSQSLTPRKSPNVSPSKNLGNSPSVTPRKSPNVSPSKNVVSSQSPSSKEILSASPSKKSLLNSHSPSSKTSPVLNLVKRASTFEDSYVSFLKAASNTPQELSDSKSPVEANEGIASSASTVLYDNENSNLEGEKNKKQVCSDIERSEITIDTCSQNVKEQNGSKNLSDWDITKLSAAQIHQDKDSSVKGSSPTRYSIVAKSPTKRSVEAMDVNYDSDATILDQDNLLYKIDSELGNKTVSQMDKLFDGECSSTDTVMDLGENVLDSNDDEIIELNNMVTSVHLIRLPENKKVFKFDGTKLKRKRRMNGTVWKILNGQNQSTGKSAQDTVSLPDQGNDIVTEQNKVYSDIDELTTDIAVNNEEKEPKTSCKKFKKKLPDAEENQNKTQTEDGGQLNEFEMALEASMKIGKKKTKKKKRLEKQLSVDSTESKQESGKSTETTTEPPKSAGSTDQAEPVSQKSDSKSVTSLGAGVKSKIVRKILRDKELEKKKNSEINLFDPSDIKSFEETIAKTDTKNKSEGGLNKKLQKSDTRKANSDVLKSLYGVGSERKILKSFRKTSNDAKGETKYRRRSPLDYGDFGGERSGLRFKMTNDMFDLSVSSPLSAGDTEPGENYRKTTDGSGSNDGGGQKKKDLLKLMEGLIEDIDSAKKNRNEISFGSERRVRFRDTEESPNVEVGRVGLIAGGLSQNTDFFHRFHGLGSKTTSPLKTPFSSPFLKRKATEEDNSVEKPFKIPRLAVKQQNTEETSEKTRAISNFVDNIRVEVGIGANNKTNRKVNFSLDKSKNDVDLNIEEGEIIETNKEENESLNEGIDKTDSWQQEVDENQGCMEGVDTSDCWQQEIEKNNKKGADIDLDCEEELDFEEEIESDKDTEQHQDSEDDKSHDGESESIIQNQKDGNREKQAESELDQDSQNDANNEKVHVESDKQNEVMANVRNMAIENTGKQLLEGFQPSDSFYVGSKDPYPNVDDNKDKDEEFTRTNDDNDNNIPDLNDKDSRDLDDGNKDVYRHSEKEQDSDTNSDIVPASARKRRGYESDNSSDADKDEDAISFYAGDESLSVMEFGKEEEKQESSDSDEDHENSEDESNDEEKEPSTDEDEEEVEQEKDKDSDEDEEEVEQEKDKDSDEDEEEVEQEKDKDSDEDEEEVEQEKDKDSDEDEEEVEQEKDKDSDEDEEEVEQEKDKDSDEDEEEVEQEKDKDSDEDEEEVEQEKDKDSDEDEEEVEQEKDKDSDDDEQKNIDTMSVCSTSHSVRSRRSIISRRGNTNDLDCIQLCVSDDEDASFLNDGGSDISSGDRHSPVDDEMTAEGGDENVDMEIADDTSIINANIQVNQPPLPVTQSANAGYGNLTRQLVPWNHCFFFLTNRCTRKDCQFIHEKLNKEDIIRYWINSFEKCLYKGNTKGIFESYKNVKTLNGQQAIPAERVTTLFNIALKNQDIDVVFKLCSDMSTHKLLDSRYCDEVIKLCHKQPSMYADKLYHLFEITQKNNGRLSNESLNILLSSFLVRNDWTKLWVVMQYCNELEDYFPPGHIIQKACDAAIKQPTPYMVPMMKWLNECETKKLEELDPKLLQRIQCEVKKIPVNTTSLKKLVDVAEVTEEFPQKEVLTTVTESEDQVEVSAEDYKHYRHRIHGCHITKNWDYLGSIFWELCNNTNSNNKNYLDAYVEALWDRKSPENLPSSLSDFITSVDKAYQIDKQEDVLAELDERSLTLICSRLLYRIYDEELWKVGYEVVSVICHKQIPCQKYFIPNRKNIIQVIMEICLNNGAPVDAFQIMLGTQWQILETNIFSTNSKEILKIFNQLLQQLIESKNLKESCTFLAALLTKADNDSKLEILSSEIEFIKAFNKIITEGLIIGNTQIAVTAYECYMNSSLKTSLPLATLRSLLASCGDCGEYDKAMQLYERLRNMQIYEVQNCLSIPRYIVLTSILTAVEIHYVISDYLNVYYNYLCERQMDGNVLTYDDLKLAIFMKWYPAPPMIIPCLDKWTFQNPTQLWSTIGDILQNKLLTPLTGNLFPDQKCFEISPSSLENYLKLKDQDCIRQGLHFVPINQPRLPKVGGAGHWGRRGRRGRPYRGK